MQTQTNTPQTHKYLWGCRECGHRYGHATGCSAKSAAAKKAAETRKRNAEACRKCWGAGHSRHQTRTVTAEGRRVYQYVRIKCEACDGTGKRSDAFVNPFKVGDILTGSWGYDQTNVEFWQVIGVTKAGVKIQKVQRFMSKDDGHATRVYATKDQFIGQPVSKRVSRDGYVKLYDFGCYLRKWDGGGRYETSWGAGH